MAHKRKTVIDLEQRVGERKKEYVRYQEGAELYSMGLNTFREIATDGISTIEKAFVDLYFSITRNGYPLSLQELVRVYTNLANVSQVLFKSF